MNRALDSGENSGELSGENPVELSDEHPMLEMSNDESLTAGKPKGKSQKPKAKARVILNGVKNLCSPLRINSVKNRGWLLAGR
jgi:hypothetical protein